MFIKPSSVRGKLRSLCWRVFNLLENNGNCLFEKNGERLFIDNLFDSFKCTKNDRKFIVFDIGANIGEYSELIKEKASQSSLSIALHLFEPTRSCYSVISDKFEADENVTLNNFAASNEDGVAMIFYDKEKSGLASLSRRNLSAYHIKMDMSEEVRLRRVDGYIEENKIQHIDFVKIDVEGHELKVFEGFGEYLSAEFVDYIQFEYGGANLDSHTSLMEIYQFLEDRGFKVAKVMPNGLEIRRYSHFMDNFSYANYVAISGKVI